MLIVNEIFSSIQGESSYAGFPCAFIRLTGCNLRCSYCDTRYAYEEGRPLSIDDIVERVKSYGLSLVEVTGGEPLLQKDTPLLIRRLLDTEFHVLVETNGSMDVSALDPRCIRIVDIKMPSSGEFDKNMMRNISILREKDELKFVIGDREDYLSAKDVLNRIPKNLYDKIVINFSPIANMIESRRLAEWLLEDKLGVRLNLQLHKIVWPEDARGV